jgi:hypothetical protein
MFDPKLPEKKKPGSQNFAAVFSGNVVKLLGEYSKSAGSVGLTIYHKAA